jgi:hypothetical protein
MRPTSIALVNEVALYVGTRNRNAFTATVGGKVKDDCMSVREREHVATTTARQRGTRLFNAVWCTAFALLLAAFYLAITGPISWAHGRGFIGTDSCRLLLAVGDIYRGSTWPGSETYRRYVFWCFAHGVAQRQHE